ncbi:hypothetical protein [Brevundimonas denitrificans]|uniref:hypothetical protein n=1 Tax=Brevundimonas denitrificans TaxID=1443434 RepID=UPI00223A7F7F|nr:hypothetical protein [Brevundimonas denitrificans]
MFALPLFRRPVSRAQAATEVVLAVLLALQPVLWAWTLGGAGRGQTEAAALTIGPALRRMRTPGTTPSSELWAMPPP